jgi:cell division septal protein FtsQ
MKQENIDEDSAERDELSDRKSSAFRSLEERQEKRRRRASRGRLIFYIISLIAVILLMLWLRRSGM